MSLSTMMTHALLGVLFILSSLWVFVETLNATDNNQGRIKVAAALATAFMWGTYLFGGYWYVVHYGADKALILKGPWPFAHSFFMETKEHIVLMVVLLATYLPIATARNLAANAAARKLVLWVSGLMVVVGLGMDGAGAIISLGVKVALQH